MRIRIVLARAALVASISCACLACHLSTSAAAGSAVSEGPAVPEVPLSFRPPFSSTSPPTASQLEADAQSRTLYEHLGTAAAVSLASRTFGLSRPTWQAPGTEGEGKVESYINDLAAVEKTSGGHSVVVASTVPLRVNSGSGLAPTSLALKHEGSVFLPENPVVPVAISDRASGGVTFGEGISVMPVGVSNAGAPTVIGDHVVFANTAPDTDVMAAPMPGGAEISWQLRSHASPDDERLLFHLPPGVVLQPSSTVPGGAEVVVEGKRSLLVEPAVAQDAEGRPVPASLSVEGATLDVHVDLSGPVDFPVLVDPTLLGEYGTYGGSNIWSGWQSNQGKEGCSPQCFSFIEAYNLLQTGANVGAPTRTVGAWSLTTPGYANKPGSAGITRVDLEGVIHHPASQSQLIATIEEDDGAAPIFSWNGEEGLSGTLPLYDQGELSNQSIAFCAQGDNGEDGGSKPLCDEENFQGHAFVIEDELLSAPTEFNYVRVGGAKVTYRDVTGPNRVELIHSGNDMEWVKTPPSGYKVSAEDEGLGIKKVEIEAPFGHEGVFKESIECSEAHGFHGCPNTWESGSANLSGLDQQESGEYSLTAVATDATGTAEPSKTTVPLFLDHEGPAISFSGPLAEAAGGNVGEGNYLLHFAAADGSPAHPQSGTYSLEVAIDGHGVFSSTTTCPKPEGRPAEGCYALSGSWTMGAQRYGVGTHAVTLTAKDWLGNESTKTLYVTVNGAAYEPLGPGSVNLTTGDYKLQSTDVSLPDGPASLSVSRTYDSRSLTEGSEGPLGPNWTLSLPDEGVGDWQSLIAQSGGSILLSASTGTQAIFAPKQGGGFVSPAGYQNLTLSSHFSGGQLLYYEISDAEGDYAQFTLASHSLYVPATIGQADGAGGLDRDTFSFTTTSEGITEPTKVLAPEPSNGACTTTLVKGCRELTFNYATSTTASGEGPTQWGDYKGRLTRVYFTAWEPVKGEMSAPIVVAQYAYDLKGRLRAEWDPRIEPAPLKTYYGYDSENHITSDTPPGQQPWLIHYGTSAGDPVTGRALSVARPAATTTAKLKERDEKTVPTNSVAPTLSTGIPAIGTTMSVSSAGTWANEPLSYAYQWQRCSSAGSECAAIEGATNKTYTPQPRDGGYTLKAQVSATNVNGTGSAVSVATSSLAMPAPASPALFTSTGCDGSGTLSSPQGDAIDSSGDVWIANYGGHCVEEISPTGAHHLETCTEGLTGPMGIAVTATHVYVADNANSTIDVYSPTCGSHKTIGSPGTNLGQLEHPDDVAVDASEDVWVADSGNNRIEEFSAEGAYITSFGRIGADRLSNPISIAFANGDLYIVDGGNNRVVIATPTGQLVGQFGSTGTGNGEFNEPAGIAEDPLSGDLDVVDTGNNRVEQFNQAGAFLAKFGSAGSGESQFNVPLGIAVNAAGKVYVGDSSNNRVQGWLPSYSTNNPAPAPPTSSGESIWSVDYGVSLGAGLLSNYSSWGQSDAPVEGTAIFPPDEPMGWPASSYKRATLTYLDHLDRAVNTVLPGGGISTAEYDEHDNTTRTLTADNRVAALAAGHKSQERAEQLDTKNTYSSDGTELISTLGPEHSVKVPSLGQIEARKHVTYSYEEGAPAAGPYHLLTKTTEAAEYVSGGSHYETDGRTVTTGYNGEAGKGQSGIGWELHEPTSTTVTVGSQELTKSTFYSPTTGEITETRSPDGSYGKTPAFNYLSAFGQPSGGQGLNEPRAVAILPSGNVDVLSAGNNMVDEYSPSGTLLKEFGGTGNESGKLSSPYQMATDNEGNVFIADTGNNRIEKFNPKGEATLTFGKEGTGAGELKEPKGVAINLATGMIYVSDSANNRIDKFTKAGVFVESFGFGVADGQNELETCKSSCRAGLAGSIAGELNEPRGIAFTGKDIWIADYSNDRVDEFTETGEFVRSAGTGGNGNMSLPKAVGVDKAGDVFVADTGRNEIEEYSASGSFLWKAGTQGTGSGQFEEPWGLALSANNHLYVADRKNNRVDQWVPTMLGNPAAHDTQTIYYTAGTEATLLACQNHPEWVGLPCQEQPAVQPEDGLPPLPTSTYTYNMWQEPLSTTDTSGTTTRTTTIAYDNAGRPKTISITSGIGTPIATTSDTYNQLNGAPATQSRTTEGVTKKLSSELNTLGELASYTDADNNTTTYTYDEDDRAKTITDAKGTQTFGYSTTSGLPTSLTDSAAGTFTAGYDAGYNLTSQGYPNGMSATYGINPVGATTSIEYLKTTHCATNCTWYKESQVPSVHGETLAQTSSLASAEYAFDVAGRLTESKTTPAASQGCTTLIYNYERDSNRTSLTTVPPETGGKCATSGGTLTTVAYDSGDRLDESGVEYDAFGNTKTLPSVDAGGAPLTSTFYADDRLASVTQNGETIGYQLDPEERTRETVSTGKTASDVISHYDGPGGAPSWTEEPVNGHWTRDIPGLGGGLEAIQTNNGTSSVEIEITNLHGDVIGTAKDTSETETHLENQNEASEYGIPTVSNPPKYSWLGELQRPTELPSGMIAMGARGYIPQLGRFLQTDPSPGGSDNPYGYTNQDPIDEADPTGEWTTTTSYNYEAASTGQAIIPIEGYIEAGALMPPPVDIQAEEELDANPPWNAANAHEIVLWERQPSREGAQAAGFLGFKVNLGSVNDWWEKVKKGYELIKETYAPALKATFEENTTVCKLTNYAITVGGYYLPDGQIAKQVGLLVGFSTTFAC